MIEFEWVDGDRVLKIFIATYDYDGGGRILRGITSFVVSSNFVLLTRNKFLFGLRIPLPAIGEDAKRNVKQTKVFLSTRILHFWTLLLYFRIEIFFIQFIYSPKKKRIHRIHNLSSTLLPNFFQLCSTSSKRQIDDHRKTLLSATVHECELTFPKRNYENHSSDLETEKCITRQW